MNANRWYYCTIALGFSFLVKIPQLFWEEKFVSNNLFATLIFYLDK